MLKIKRWPNGTNGIRIRVSDSTDWIGNRPVQHLFQPQLTCSLFEQPRTDLDRIELQLNHFKPPIDSDWTTLKCFFSFPKFDIFCFLFIYWFISYPIESSMTQRSRGGFKNIEWNSLSLFATRHIILCLCQRHKVDELMTITLIQSLFTHMLRYINHIAISKSS